MLKLHLAVFLFGLAGLFGKLLHLPPTAIVLGRTALGAVTLLAILQITRTPRHMTRARILRAIPSGLLLAVHWVTFFRAIQVSSVAIGLLSYATFPIFVVLLDALLSRSRLLMRDLLLAVVVFAGLALVVPKYELGNRTAQGALWGLVSGLTFALLTIWNRTLVRGTPAIVVALWQNVWAAAALLPLGQPLLHLSFPQALLLGLLGVFCTAVAHWLFIDALKTGARAGRECHGRAGAGLWDPPGANSTGRGSGTSGARRRGDHPLRRHRRGVVRAASANWLNRT